jgi:hypothetical protein
VDAVESYVSKTLRGKKLLVGWLLATLFSGIVGTFILGVPRYYRLEMHGIPLEGSIAELQPYNHGSVIYQYQVDGQILTGGGHGGDIDADFSELRLGQMVSIFYDPANKADSCMGDPKRHLYQQLTGNAFIATFPTLMLLGMKIRGLLSQH